MVKFLEFIELLETDNNISLVNNIRKGYITCFESEIDEQLKERIIIRPLSEKEKNYFVKVNPNAYNMVNNLLAIVDTKFNDVLKMTKDKYEAEKYKDYAIYTLKNSFDEEHKLPNMPVKSVLTEDDFQNWWDAYEDYLDEMRQMAQETEREKGNTGDYGQI
jgi:hypothetical protein